MKSVSPTINSRCLLKIRTRKFTQRAVYGAVVGINMSRKECSYAENKLFLHDGSGSSRSEMCNEVDARRINFTRIYRFSACHTVYFLLWTISNIVCLGTFPREREKERSYVREKQSNNKWSVSFIDIKFPRIPRPFRTMQGKGKSFMVLRETRRDDTFSREVYRKFQG